MPRGSRFALVVTLVLGLLALPLSETWRRQGLELDAALAARRALEPLGLAVQTQRALLAHRPQAAAVLAGRGEQEDERLRLQHLVELELGNLVAALDVQHLHRALDEADHLQGGWRALLMGIQQRRLDAAASDLGHDLLIEQTLVVADLVATRSGLHAVLGPAGHPLALADAGEAAALAWSSLPRFVAAHSRHLHGDGSTAPPASTPAAADRAALRELAGRIARAAGATLAAADAAAIEGRSTLPSPPSPQEARALLALQQAAARLAEPASAPDAALLHRAAAAGFEATQVLQARVAAGLTQMIEARRLERALVGAALAALLLLAAAAALRAVPRADADPADEIEGGHEPLGADDGEALHADAPPPSESEGPASDLMRRLREPAAGPAPGTAGPAGPSHPARPTRPR